ncbi:MAG: NfeD family protein [Acholeplasmatales bacterium]|nr:NfeD family protein [Acholeplasmatales bacterium]
MFYYELLGLPVLVWVWLGVVILSLVVEFMTSELVSIWFFVGSFVSMILALCKVDEAIQVIVFVLVSLLFMLAARPIVKKWTKRNEIKTNVDSLVGRIALVTEDIIDGERGVVKLDSQEWSAISNDNINKGTKVVILSIEGNKLIVKENKKSDNDNIKYE